MDTVPTAEQVHLHICKLYTMKDINAMERERHNIWLKQFQKSSIAWTVAQDLLQRNYDTYTSFFAAQTLRSKIQTSLEELPQTSQESLLNSLIAYFGQITDDHSSAVVTQVGLSVANLALLMSSWQHPSEDMIGLMAARPNSTYPLLVTLALLPEELDSQILKLDTQQRTQLLCQLKAASTKLMELLHEICMRPADALPERTLEAALNCFRAWMGANAIPDAQQCADSAVIQQVFHILSASNSPEKLHDIATKCACALLNFLKLGDYYTHSSEKRAAATLIFNRVCALEPAYRASLDPQNVDRSLNYAQIFSILCNTCLKEILDSKVMPKYSIKGIELVLRCMEHFDIEVANTTLNFWGLLTVQLFHSSLQLKERFRWYMDRLLGLLYRRSQLNTDFRGLMDEHDSFHRFRLRVSSVISDLAAIAEPGVIFKQMFRRLREPDSNWQSTEVTLFVMQCVAKQSARDENYTVQKVMDGILLLPEDTHIAVRYTSIKLLGELCEWLETHAQSLPAVMDFLHYSMQQCSGVANVAASVMSSICVAHANRMIYHIQALLEIARILRRYEMSNDRAIDLLQSISIVLTHLPYPQQHKTMLDLISIYLQQLTQMLEDHTETTNNKHNKDVVFLIDCVCAVVEQTKPDLSANEMHPKVQILLESWPLISRVMDKYQADENVVEHACCFVQQCLWTVGRKAAPLFSALVEQIATIYALHGHICLLGMGATIVSEFGRCPECSTRLLEMLQTFTGPTFSLLQVECGFVNNPNTVEQFFFLCLRFTTFCPMAFLQSPLIEPILQCALFASTVDNSQVHSSVMRFLRNLFNFGHNKNRNLPGYPALLKQIALQTGEAFIVQLIQASAFSLQSIRLHGVADVIIQLKAVLPSDQMKAFLMKALQELSKTNSGVVTAKVTPQQLEEFYNAVLECTSAKILSSTLKCFAQLFRRL